MPAILHRQSVFSNSLSPAFPTQAKPPWDSEGVFSASELAEFCFNSLISFPEITPCIINLMGFKTGVILLPFCGVFIAFISYLHYGNDATVQNKTSLGCELYAQTVPLEQVALLYFYNEIRLLGFIFC